MMIETATHPAMIAAYREYMQVRSQARQDLIGGGAVATPVAFGSWNLSVCGNNTDRRST
jgi:hypothetical protein